MDPEVVVPVAGIFMIISLVLGFPVVRAITRKIDRQGRYPGVGASEERLERIEHAIDAMSLEIERISEGQRFLTKLLSEGAAPPASISAAPGTLDRERVR